MARAACPPVHRAVRYHHFTMKIHEYQARGLLAEAGIPVPPGAMVQSVDDAVAEADELFDAGSSRVVIKAQVHAGGRGKAGFVKLVSSTDEVRDAAKYMLSNRLVSPQTPPEGLEVKRLLVAAAVDIAVEYYLAITVDRARHTNTMIASAEGGVEIEAVAERSPDSIHKVPLHPLLGLQPHQARSLAFALGFTGKQVGQAVDIMLIPSVEYQTSLIPLKSFQPPKTHNLFPNQTLV